MPQPRSSLALTSEEQQRMLDEGWTMHVTSIGPNGYPHTVEMWYVVIDGLIHFTTYKKSQKILNLQKNPRLTVALNSGREYAALKALVIQGDATMVDDIYFTSRIRGLVGDKYGFNEPGTPIEVTEADAKRCVVRIQPVKTYSWDHAKLRGAF